MMGAGMGGQKGGRVLWPPGSEVRLGTPPHLCLLRVREAEKNCAPDPFQSVRPRPIPLASPGLWGAGGCRVRLAAAPRVGDFIAMGR